MDAAQKSVGGAPAKHRGQINSHIPLDFKTWVNEMLKLASELLDSDTLPVDVPKLRRAGFRPRSCGYGSHRWSSKPI